MYVCLGKSYSPSQLLVDRGKWRWKGSSLGSFHEVASQVHGGKGFLGDLICALSGLWLSVSTNINPDCPWKVRILELLPLRSCLCFQTLTSASRKDWIQAPVCFWFAVDDTQHTLPHFIVLDLDKQRVKRCNKRTYVKIGVLWRQSSHEKHLLYFMYMQK